MDLKRAMHLHDVVTNEYNIRDGEQREHWVQGIESLRDQLLELDLDTEGVDYILSIVSTPEPENPRAEVGKIEWV